MMGTTQQVAGAGEGDVIERRLFAALVTAGLAAAAIPLALAHSVEELGQELRDREKYFQPLDKEAPEFTLEDADGRTFSLDSLRGKVIVLHFIYASCPDFCPLHADLIARVQEMVNQTPTREQVQFFSITTDPENDTPEALRDYGPAHGLDPSNWAFLTSGPDRHEDTTRKLAESFGHGFTKAEDGYQVHSVVTHVIGPDGRWRANFHGLEFEPTNLVTYINALANEHGSEGHPQQSWWDRIVNLF
jgi:protein SCO1/2